MSVKQLKERLRAAHAAVNQKSAPASEPVPPTPPVEIPPPEPPKPKTKKKKGKPELVGPKPQKKRVLSPGVVFRLPVGSSYVQRWDGTNWTCTLEVPGEEPYESVVGGHFRSIINVNKMRHEQTGDGTPLENNRSVKEDLPSAPESIK